MDKNHVEIAYCPVCDTRIRFFEKPALGDQVRCPECRNVVEVVSVDPIKLERAYDTDSPSMTLYFR